MGIFHAFYRIEITAPAQYNGRRSLLPILEKLYQAASVEALALATMRNGQSGLIVLHRVAAQEKDPPVIYTKAIKIMGVTEKEAAKAAIELAGMMETGYVVVSDGSEIIMRAYAADTPEQAMGLCPRPIMRISNRDRLHILAAE